MTLSGRLLRPVRIGPLLLYHKIHSGAVSVEKDKYLTPAHSLKVTTVGHQIVPYDLKKVYRQQKRMQNYPVGKKLSFS